MKPDTPEWRARRVAYQRAYVERHRDELREKHRAYVDQNREKIREQHRQWRKVNARRVRDQHLQATYGISHDQYDAMLERQGGGCAVCGKGRTLVVDHDHDTGKVRGILCGGCNRGIGQMGDDASRVLAAARYLEDAL